MAGTERVGRLPALSLQRVITVLALLVVIYSGFTMAGSLSRHAQLQEQAAQLREEIAKDQNEYQQLQVLQRYMQSDDFIEAAARDEGLVRPGDIAIVVSAPSDPSSAQQRAVPWWQRYLEP